MEELFSTPAVFYTDLMPERHRAGHASVDFSRSAGAVGVWERINVKSDEAAKELERPRGHYHTLTTPMMDKIDSYDVEDIAEEIASELWRMCEFGALVPKKLLVVGLGNADLTPDSLGPLSAGRIEATMHIKRASPEMFSALGCIEIAVICPGVLAQSGIEAYDTVAAVCQRIKPDLVVAIDALCTASEERLGCTVQISDTGIFPGSGVGSPKKEISQMSIGHPVFSIGIPTVMDSGIISKRSRGERMLVTPREINAIVSGGAQILAEAVNRAFGIVL